jgi:hypothetical protein
MDFTGSLDQNGWPGGLAFLEEGSPSMGGARFPPGTGFPSHSLILQAFREWGFVLLPTA